MTITFDDRATFAALKGYGKRIGYSSLERMRDALEEALPHLRVQETPDAVAIHSLHEAIEAGIARALRDFGADLTGCTPSLMTGHIINEIKAATMADETLRQALASLVDKWQYTDGKGYRGFYEDVGDLLAAHPAPHLRPVVPDLAGALRQSVDAARARRLGRPVVDREALERVLATCQKVRDREGPSGMINASQILGLLSPTWPDGNYASGDPAVALLPTEEGEGSQERNDTHPVGRRSQPGIHHAEDCPLRWGVGPAYDCNCGREGERDS